MQELVDLRPFLNAEWQDMLGCPICQFEYNHIERVEVNQGGEKWEITRTGPGIAFGEAAGRGSRIGIDMHCESGHFWTLVLQFHKGHVYVYAEERPQLAGWPKVDAETLWRD